MIGTVMWVGLHCSRVGLHDWHGGVGGVVWLV